MTAPLNYAAMKSGAGRPTGKGKRVADVESQPCLGRDGNHWLRNSAQRGGLVTACIGCGLSWSEIDAALRGAE